MLQHKSNGIKVVSIAVYKKAFFFSFLASTFDKLQYKNVTFDCWLILS